MYRAEQPGLLPRRNFCSCGAWMVSLGAGYVCGRKAMVRRSRRGVGRRSSGGRLGAVQVDMGWGYR
ncbi:hypothetical protein P280DRAFT_464370, partial [Massarina eburnea CBS 473.64]